MNIHFPELIKYIHVHFCIYKHENSFFFKSEILTFFLRYQASSLSVKKELTLDTENYQKVLHQTYYDITDKKHVSFEDGHIQLVLIIPIMFILSFRTYVYPYLSYENTIIAMYYIFLSVILIS